MVLNHLLQVMSDCPSPPLPPPPPHKKQKTKQYPPKKLNKRHHKATTKTKFSMLYCEMMTTLWPERKKENSTIHMIVPPWPVAIKTLPIPFVPAVLNGEKWCLRVSLPHDLCLPANDHTINRLFRVKKKDEANNHSPRQNLRPTVGLRVELRVQGFPFPKRKSNFTLNTTATTTVFTLL